MLSVFFFHRLLLLLSFSVLLLVLQSFAGQHPRLFFWCMYRAHNLELKNSREVQKEEEKQGKEISNTTFRQSLPRTCTCLRRHRPTFAYPPRSLASPCLFNLLLSLALPLRLSVCCVFTLVTSFIEVASCRDTERRRRTSKAVVALSPSHPTGLTYRSRELYTCVGARVWAC